MMTAEALRRPHGVWGLRRASGRPGRLDFGKRSPIESSLWECFCCAAEVSMTSIREAEGDSEEDQLGLVVLDLYYSWSSYKCG